jgi:hypothetical protein
MRAIKLVLAVGIVSLTTGCAGLIGENMFTGQDEGRFLLSSDAEGLRAFGDSLTGLITEGKASPDIKSAYWQNADARVEVKKFRILSARPAQVANKK